MTDDLTSAVPLPPAGDGSRSARHRPGRRRSRRPGRRWLLVLPALLVVGALVGASLLRDGGDDADPPGAPVAEAPSGGPRRTGVVLGRDEAGTLVSATLLVVGPSGGGGDIVHLPPGTMVEASSLGLVPLREAAGQSDALAVSALENLLGIRLPAAVTVGPAELAAALAPIAPVEVALPERVQRQVGNRLETVFPAGPVQLDAARAMELLAAPATTDLDRLVRHQAFWTGWLAAIASRPAGGPGSALGPAGTVVADLAGDEVRHHTLPVEALAGAQELYRVDRAKLDRLLHEILPAAPTGRDRIAVQVLNGTGAPGLAQALVGPMVDAGARVALTGNADDFDHEKTQIVYYADDGAATARRLRDAFGVGEIVRSRARIDVVDLTIIVGRDFPLPTPGSTATSEGAPS